MKKPSSINPTLAVVSFWWKKSGKDTVQLSLGKTIHGLGELGLVLMIPLLLVAFLGLVFFFLGSGAILCERVVSGNMGNPWIAPWDWLSAVGMAHPVEFIFLATFFGAFGVSTLVIPFGGYSVEPVENMPSWILFPLGVLGIVFFFPGVASWVVIGLVFVARKACCWFFLLPSRLKSRRDAYLEENPEILARLEKERLESGTDPATAPSRNSRL